MITRHSSSWRAGSSASGKMNSLQLRVPLGLAGRLLQEVHRPAVREPVVFALISAASIGPRGILLVRDVVIPPESAFLPSQGHGARWRGSYTIELLNRALAEKLGICIFHAHGHSTRVQMSSDDRQSAAALLPKFQLVMPGRPHGSVVLGEGSAAGLVLMPGRDEPTEAITVRFLDEALSTWPLPRFSEEDALLFNRQPLAECAALRTILRNTCVAVVGLSGGGSQVVAQLAALGVGEIIGIDNQTVDGSNRFATPNLGWLDALTRLRKTTAAKIRTWLINRDVRFSAVNGRVPEPAVVEVLKRADIIVGSVNNLHARADLNEIAWRYCIPYIDIGLIVATDHRSEVEPPSITAISGNISTLLPGGPCLWCTGFVSKERLDLETGGRGRPYLQGKTERNAYVTAFNGTLACEAANEVLRLLTGIRRGNEMKRVYNGFSGTMFECTVKRKHTCDLCTTLLGAGDPLWS